MNTSMRIIDESSSTIPASAPSHPSQEQEQESTTRTCPCKKLPLSLSSFTAAEYGDLHSLAKKASSSTTTGSRLNLVNQKDRITGYTPLHLAAQHGHVAATSFLLQLGCSIDATMLHRTAFSGSVATLRILLQHMQQQQQQQKLLLAKDETFGDLRTPLHKAAAGGRYLAVHLLLETLRESNLLKEALTIEDSNQQTPLDVAWQLIGRQDEERQSVARWDEVACGIADWSKCVQLLSNAETEVGIAGFDDREGDDGGMVIHQRQQQQQQQQRRQQLQPEAMTIPTHLTRLNDLNGCIGCTDPNGNCLTASWQNAFQKALGTVVEQTLSNRSACVPCPVTPNRTKAVATTTTTTTPTSSSFVERQQISTNTSSRSPNPTVISSGGVSDQRGTSCSECGKPCIALYPSLSSKGQRRLVCKQCKRKKL